MVHTCRFTGIYHYKDQPSTGEYTIHGVVALMSSQQTADDLPVRNHSHTIHVTGIFTYAYIHGWLIFVVVNEKLKISQSYGCQGEIRELVNKDDRGVNFCPVGS